MSFADDVRAHSKNAHRWRSALPTEAATISALVLPLLKILEYDVFNPMEVVHQAPASYGNAKYKVDLELRDKGTPNLLIECKQIGTPLDGKPWEQLAGYFNAVKTTRIALLTNGTGYRFYGGTQPNAKYTLDETPFFTFDLLAPTDESITELEQFTKSNFNADELIDTVSERLNRVRNIAVVKEALTQFLVDPLDFLPDPPNQTTRKFLRRLIQKTYNPNLSMGGPFPNYDKEILLTAFREFQADPPPLPDSVD